MRLIRYQSPFLRSSGVGGLSPFAGFESEFDRLFGQANEGPRFPITFGEDQNNAYVRVELPGVKREEITLEIVDGDLKVSATRQQQDKEQKTEGGSTNGTGEFSYGRTITLPENVDAEKVAASYENGLLTVTLPKRDAAKPRTVAIS